MTGLTQAVGAKMSNLKTNITHQFRKGKETVVDARNKVADYSLEKTCRQARYCVTTREFGIHQLRALTRFIPEDSVPQLRVEL